MSDLRIKELRLSDAVVAAILAVSGNVISYVYEYVIAIYYGIPVEIIEISFQSTLISYGVLALLFFLALFIVTSISNRFDKHLDDEFRKFLLLVVGAVYILLFQIGSGMADLTLLLLVLSLVIVGVWYFLGKESHSKKKNEPNHQHKVKPVARSSQKINFVYMGSSWNLDMVVLMLPTAVLIAMHSGFITAQKKVTYKETSDTKEKILRIYGDVAITAKVENGRISNQYHIRSISNDLSYSVVYTGPLSR